MAGPRRQDDDLGGAPRPPVHTGPTPASSKGSQGAYSGPQPTPTYQVPGDYGAGVGNFGPDAARPGWGLGIEMVPGSIGDSQVDYDEWLMAISQNANFQAMRTAFGDDFVAFQWLAYNTQMDGINYRNQLGTRFAGYEKIIDNVNGRGSRGGGGGGADPAVRLGQIEAAKAAIKNQSAILGRTEFTDEELTALATTVVDGNWSNDMVVDELLRDPANITRPGTVQVADEDIRAQAGRQLIKVSDATAREWSMRINSGEMTMDAVNLILANQAKSEFGWAADSIGQGMTMRDILMPARDRIADELELDGESVDFMDDRWRKMATTLSADGTARAATLTEVQRNARKDSMWAGTNNAARLATNTGLLLRQMFED